MLNGMLDKYWRNDGWKFLSFVRIIQHVSSNLQAHAFFHSMSKQRWRQKAETSIGFFPQHNKRTHCGWSIRIQGNVSEECGGLRNCFKAYRWPYLSTRNLRRSWPCIIRWKTGIDIKTPEIRNCNIRNDIIRMKCWMNHSHKKQIVWKQKLMTAAVELAAYK